MPKRGCGGALVPAHSSPISPPLAIQVQKWLGTKIVPVVVTSDMKKDKITQLLKNFHNERLPVRLLGRAQATPPCTSSHLLTVRGCLHRGGVATPRTSHPCAFPCPTTPPAAPRDLGLHWGLHCGPMHALCMPYACRCTAEHLSPL